MHELSIANNIISEVETAARENGASSVSTVTLAIGRLCGIVPGALQFGFEIAREGTLLDQAELLIEEEPVVVWCPDGNHTVQLLDMVFRCPDHGCQTPEILSGKGMEILRFEIADSVNNSLEDVTG